MEPERNEVHVGTEAGRAGSTPHVVRWILIIGLFLAIGALTIIWVTGALSQEDLESQRQVTDIVQERDLMGEEDDVDVIISDEAADMERAPEVGNTEEQPLDMVDN